MNSIDTVPSLPRAWLQPGYQKRPSDRRIAESDRRRRCGRRVGGAERQEPGEESLLKEVWLLAIEEANALKRKGVVWEHGKITTWPSKRVLSMTRAEAQSTLDTIRAYLPSALLNVFGRSDRKGRIVAIDGQAALSALGLL